VATYDEQSLKPPCAGQGEDNVPPDLLHLAPSTPPLTAATHPLRVGAQVGQRERRRERYRRSVTRRRALVNPSGKVLRSILGADRGAFHREQDRRIWSPSP
jgi:hypothetical protein